jgi:signal transduction histidine kinase
MSLTQQFVLVSLLPAVLLLLGVYLWWADVRQRRVALFLTLALLAATVWASGAITYYGGRTMPMEMRFTWRVVSNHALSLVPIWLFLATAVYLGLARSYRVMTLAAALLLWLAALALDPAIWRYDLPSFFLFGQTVRHFDVWAAVWITAALLPLSVAWWLTYRTANQMPASHYRNQTDYWWLALSCFLLAAGLALPRELLYQQVAILLAIGGGLSSAAVLSRDYLPNLQTTVRQLARTVVLAAVVFTLSWFAFSFAGQELATWPAELRNGAVAMLAAIFTLLFLLVTMINGRRSRRLITMTIPESAWLSDPATGGVLTPAEVGLLATRAVQNQLACDDVWLLTAHSEAGGQLLLRAALAPSMVPPAVALPATAVLTGYFRQNHTPLLQYDLDNSSKFTALSEVEHSLLAQWQRSLFAPLRIGERLVGILALGRKTEPDPYDQVDIARVEEIAGPIALLLAQAQQVTGLVRTIDHLAQQNSFLAYEKQRLQELTRLYNDFVTLISPELRQPFITMERDLERTEVLAGSGRPPSFDPLRRQVECLREMITNLVNMAARVQQQQEFSFQAMGLDDVVREVQQGLQHMAAARRVRVELHLEESSGVMVYGDSRRLREAVQYLMHNAIKFNKIGGLVRIESGVNGRELFLHVLDNGVGIPQERLPTIWSGFTDLQHINVYNPKGAGMGLLLTRFIVHAHGGRVEASSTYGRGSVFSVYLPTV